MDLDLEKLDLSEFGVGKGISITTGFDVASNKPLDARTVVRDMDELANMPSGMIHLGLTVFVISENKLYQWKFKTDENGEAILNEEGKYIEEWGAIESEVATKEIINIIDEIDFENTPTLMLQKNKSNFFPYTHENSIFVDNEGKLLPEKYQTIVEPTLKTMSKTIPEAINEVNDYLDEKLAIFNEQLKDKLAEIDKQVERAEQSITDAEQELQDKLEQVEEDIDDRIDQMLQNVDNVILTDGQCTSLMDQIRANLALLENGTGDNPTTTTFTFETYAYTTTVDTATTEVSIAPLRAEVTSKDKLFAHINSVYLTEGVDYRIDYENQKIVNITNTPWNSYEIAGCEFTFDLIKIVEVVSTANISNYAIATIEEDGIEPYSVTDSIHYMSTVVIENESVSEVKFDFVDLTSPITIEDKLFVHLNSVYLTEGVDYRIDYEANKIISLDEEPWIAEGETICEFTFELMKK